ncbi:Os12g0589300 [Oryza sativa Japonica Group]|uniref:Os12g0589300 protein n=1 Tax=Oryza sativa subsp. japonica TaxID=39947 RepID=A0A0P0YC19_ORYSJ|nr:Os12g0589300 [Oryza sativa Japonica Group]
MVKRAMRSPVALYIHEEEEGEGEGEGEERECGGGSCMLWKAFFGHYFIPSWFPSYLHEDPIQSLERMEMLRQEREKQEFAMLDSIDW